jgi:small-conductance mechanosensitive channel
MRTAGFWMALRSKYIGNFLLFMFICCAGQVYAAEKQNTPETAATAIVAPKDMGKAIKKEADKVKKDLKRGARLYFDRKALGWDIETIGYLYGEALSVPGRFPDSARYAMGHARVPGLVVLLAFLFFTGAWAYSRFGQQRIIAHVEKKLETLAKRLPPKAMRYFQSGLNVAAAAFMPALLLCLFSLIQAMSGYQAAWFQLIGGLLGLWAVGVIAFRFLQECFAWKPTAARDDAAEKIFRWIKIVLFYALLAIALFRAVELLELRKDVLALLKTLVSLSIVVILGLLFSMKNALFPLIPDLPYRGIRTFLKFFNLYYYPLLVVSILAGVLWCFGYAAMGSLILSKIWLTFFAFLVIIITYHVLNEWLTLGQEKLDDDEAARFLSRSAKSALVYAIIVASAFVVLNLLGLLHFLQRMMSFPIFQMGKDPISSWIILKAILILIGFIFASRVLQAYLTYSVYPSLGIDEGLGYALNTLLKYVSFAVGLLISLNIVGIDLQFLLVFAGAIGIGVGFGIQHIASNFIGGLMIIFGGKIRKGDWVEVNGELGLVADIFMNATMIRNRDNIEYLIPNSDIISKPLINYSLSSPLVRISLPVCASYQSDPRTVKRILLDVASKEPMVSKDNKPDVILAEYADSAVNFLLRIWIDIREIAQPQVRSELYFAIFDEFKKAGIEIPFPQRDVHIKSEI